MRNTFKAALLVSSALIATPVLAQQQPTPPEHYTLNGQGVDLVQGTFNHSATDVVIGQPGQGGLAFGRVWTSNGWRDSIAGTIQISGSTYVVSLGGMSEAFTKSGSTFTPLSNTGATLTQSGAALTFTASDGTQAIYSTVYAGATSAYLASGAALMEVVRPNGEETDYTYDGVTYCSLREDSPDPEEPGECLQWANAVRLDSIRNNYGYQINLIYDLDTVPDDFAEVRDEWLRRTGVRGVNLAVDYCPPTGSTCTTSRTWPSATYVADEYGGGITSVTDQSGRTTTYSYDGGGRLNGVRLPGASSDIISVTYDGAGKVANVTDPSGSWNYTYTDVGTVRTTVAEGPENLEITAVSDLTIGRATSVENEPGEKWQFEYDSQNRLTRTVAPELDAVSVTYDARGNIITTAREAIPDPMNPLPDLVTSATYAPTCAEPTTCNKPLTTTDANLNVTNYVWDDDHGGLLSVTLPAPSSGAARPQTRFTYSGVNARYHNSTTTFTSGSTITLPTATSACTTGSSCSSAANEVKTTVVYGHVTDPHNLAPSSTTSGSGNGALAATTTMTWTEDGDLATVTDPRGTGHTTQYRYDDARQLIGVVGPDPDAAGALKHRAQRLTRDPRGQVTLVEAGTVNGYSNTDWTGFVTLQRQAMTYDAMERTTLVRTQSAAGTTRATVQMSYDDAGRIECTTQRMNIYGLDAPPSSACYPEVQGFYGPDRITQTVYDNAGRILSTTSGLTTSAAITESLTYTDNGQVETLTDGVGNTSTLTYDRYDRPVEMTYPGGTLSETYGYDAASNVTSHVDRSARNFTYGYDFLNRLTTVTAPSGTPGLTYAYDNLGRTTQVTDGTTPINMTWDALGRLTSQGGVLGNMSMEYDLVGNRTALIWPDAFRVTYAYDRTSAMKTIYEGTGANVIATYSYDDLGRPTAITRGNGTSSGYAYDDVSRLSSLSTVYPASPSHNQTWSYLYNPAGQVTLINSPNILYDYTGRSAGVVDTDNNDLNQATLVGGLDLDYNNEGELVADGSTGRTYGYDAYGRPVTLSGSASGSLSWDAMGRLRTMVGTNGASYLYDFDGAMVGTTINGSTIHNRPVPGASIDEVVVAYQGPYANDPRWTTTDRLNSTATITDSTGAVNAVNSYDEYGRPGSANGSRRTYTGQMWLPDWGMYHYKNRQYRPDLGRFLQTDPIGYGAGANLYAYVGGNPVNMVDPTGLLSICQNLVRYTGTYMNSGTRDGFTWKEGETAWQYDAVENGVCAYDIAPFDLGDIVHNFGGGGTDRPNTCAANRARHEAALDRELERYRRAGFRVTRNVSFRDPQQGDVRVVADAAIGFFGPVGFPGATPPAHILIDVKTGDGGFTPNQRIVYPRLGQEYVLVPVGIRALQAGYIPGFPVSVRHIIFETPRYDGNGNRCP